MPAPNAISSDKLSKIIGTPRAPALPDVRSEEDFGVDPRPIPGAIRTDGRSLTGLPDDVDQLEAGMLLHDAFYRWARDASDETHNWPTNKPKA